MQLPVVNAFFYQYEVTLNRLCKISKNDYRDAVSQSKAASHLLSMENFAVYFLLRVLHKLLIILSPVHRLGLSYKNPVFSPSRPVSEFKIRMQQRMSFYQCTAAITYILMYMCVHGCRLCGFAHRNANKMAGLESL